uniref:Uncharacterized protein n=1 Tax=Rhizophora mucronata TaxID=61149 RepID=A0A2P2J3P0_RHIMU
MDFFGVRKFGISSNCLEFLNLRNM